MFYSVIRHANELVVGVCIRNFGLVEVATYEQLALKNVSCHVSIGIRYR